MNLQVKSAVSRCGAYGCSYEYRSNGVFEAGCLQRTTAAWAIAGQVILAAQPASTVMKAKIQAEKKARGVLR